VDDPWFLICRSHSLALSVDEKFFVSFSFVDTITILLGTLYVNTWLIYLAIDHRLKFETYMMLALLRWLILCSTVESWSTVQLVWDVFLVAFLPYGNKSCKGAIWQCIGVIGCELAETND